MQYPSLAKQIIDLKNQDLAMRDELIRQGQLGNGYHEDMEAMHRQNAEILNGIMDTIGFPTLAKVGKAGNEAAWLIIQHAIGHSSFMKKCAKLLEKAVEDQQASPIHLAYLTDRIAVYEGKPQLYGTQFDWDEHGAMSPQVYDDVEAVNHRRKRIGLNTLEEQTELMRKRVIEEHQEPPEDYQQRKEKIHQWKKSVGWIK